MATLGAIVLVNPLYANGFFLLAWYNKLYISRGVGLFYFFRYWVFVDLFCFNRVDPREMEHYAAFHLGLHCLKKYLLRGFPKCKVLDDKKHFGTKQEHMNISCSLYKTVGLWWKKITFIHYISNSSCSYIHFSVMMSVCRGPFALSIYSTHGTPSFMHPLWLQKKKSDCFPSLSYAYLR